MSDLTYRRVMSSHRDPGVGLNAAVAAELRAERVALGMTLDALASASGISKVSVQRYLRPTRYIDMETLDLLAGAMGVHPETIMDRAVERLGRSVLIPRQQRRRFHRQQQSRHDRSGISTPTS